MTKFGKVLILNRELDTRILVEMKRGVGWGEAGIVNKCRGELLACCEANLKVGHQVERSN